MNNKLFYKELLLIFKKFKTTDKMMTKDKHQMIFDHEKL